MITLPDVGRGGQNGGVLAIRDAQGVLRAPAATAPAWPVEARTLEGTSRGSYGERVTKPDASADDHAVARFDDLVALFLDREGVVPPGATAGFGSSALRVDGRIFAMLVRGRLVVKLPSARVTSLVESGAGIPFDANKGTPMKEWFSLDPVSNLEWERLADEAYAFVSAAG